MWVDSIIEIINSFVGITVLILLIHYFSKKQNEFYSTTFRWLILTIIFFNMASIHFYDEVRDGSFYAIYMVIIFYTINLFFLTDFKSFIESSHSINEIYKKFKILVSYGIFNILLFANVYYYYGIEGKNGLVDREVITSIYFSIVTWTTLGYGDYSPPTPSLQLIAAIEALMGYVYMALLIGIFLNIARTKVKKD